VARMDPRLLYPIRHRGPQAQQDLALIRGRDALVRSRTLQINHVRATFIRHVDGENDPYQFVSGR